MEWLRAGSRLKGRGAWLGALLLAGCAGPPPAAAPAATPLARVAPSPTPVLAATEPAAAEPRLPPNPVLPPGPTWINRPPAPEPVPGTLAALAPPPRPAAPRPETPQAAAPAPATPPAPAVQPAAAAVPRPGLGTEDRRVAVDNAEAPWRSIGLVAAEGGARCTGALIGPRQVLTAAHCLIRRGTDEPQPPSGVKYVIGQTAQSPGREVAVAGIRIAPGFRALPGPRPDRRASPDSDWAILTLDPAAPEAPPELILPLVQGLLPAFTPLAFGGYQPDRGRGLVADLECWILHYARDSEGRIMLRHTCSATGGSSGGPLLARRPDGSWMVAGIGSLAMRERIGGWAVPSLVVLRAMEARPRPGQGS